MNKIRLDNKTKCGNANRLGIVTYKEYNQEPCLVIKEADYIKNSLRYSLVLVDNKVEAILNKFIVFL